MDYISSKEIAELWGISPRRVAILAKEGRIPGSMQIGHSLMIPRDAQKPSDPRKKKPDDAAPRSEFPMFLFSFDGTGNERPHLNNEEQLLYDAQECYVHNEIEKSEKMLQKLIRKSSDTYIRFGCFVTLGYISIETHDIALYEKCIWNLHIIFVDDFPGKDKLLYFLDELEAYRAGRSLWAKDLELDPAKTFGTESYPFSVAVLFYNRMIRQADGTEAADTSLLEMVCHEFDRHGYYFSSQLVHTYLACTYFLAGRTGSCMEHLRTAMDIGARFDSYYPLASAYRFLGSACDRLLAEYPESVKKKLLKRCVSLSKGVELLTDHYSGVSTSQKILSLRDYEYIVYALSGMKNEDIALFKGISVTTVSKHYSSVCSLCGVKNKKQLIDLVRSSKIQG